jgi:hypothetical protein
MENGFSLEGLIVGGGILATLLGLLIERVVTSVGDVRTHRAEKQRLRSFLNRWYSDVTVYFDEIEKDAQDTKKVWSQYRENMQAQEGKGEAFPWLPYHRCSLPDIAPMVCGGLRYLSEEAYSSLLFMNGRMKVLDERNAMFSDFFTHVLCTDLSAATRAKAAKIIDDNLSFVVQISIEAKKISETEGLTMWLAGKERA